MADDSGKGENFYLDTFVRSENMQWTLTRKSTENVATFAAGCFWGVEHIFLKHFPQLKTRVGYSNGKEDIANPSYRQVCSGSTDYAEALRIEFDPSYVTYAQLVGACQSRLVVPLGGFVRYLTSTCAEHFYRTHDPTTENRQGGDVGTREYSTRTVEPFSSPISKLPFAEYRSGIFTHTDEQMRIAKEVTEKVQKEHFTSKGLRIVTEIQPAGTWYDAEVSVLVTLHDVAWY